MARGWEVWGGSRDSEGGEMEGWDGGPGGIGVDRVTVSVGSELSLRRVETDDEDDDGGNIGMDADTTGILVGIASRTPSLCWSIGS